MRIVCIRPLPRALNNTDRWSVLKGLKEGEFYNLYDGYDINDEYIYLKDRSVPETYTILGGIFNGVNMDGLTVDGKPIGSFDDDSELPF